jgi:hypothetical protein
MNSETSVAEAVRLMAQSMQKSVHPTLGCDGSMPSPAVTAHKERGTRTRVTTVSPVAEWSEDVSRSLLTNLMV